ncbi:MAG TPA: 1,4-alpha-glucan branching enzyme, partial [Pseudorhodoferax sp.]|nr:1,4-alpha-glucan branching enzyme [Pseudorhodoferax sp.]
MRGAGRQAEGGPVGASALLGETDLWLLAEGTHLRPYEALGAHPRVHHGVAGTRFALWAPNARRVSVVGDFNGWDGRVHPLHHRPGAGVWEAFVPGVDAGALYKYELEDAEGRLLPLKADPYALAAQLRPDTASRVARLPPPVPASAARRAANAIDAPIAIYEVHLASWRRRQDEGDRWLAWDEL